MKTLATNTKVAVLGAGPVGLAAAAHLLQRGLSPILFESGQHIAAHLASFGHVQLFSPWRYNIDHAAAQLLRKHHWNEPPLDELPTAGEIIEKYLSPLSRVPAIAQNLHLNTTVTALSRTSIDKVKSTARDATTFVIRTTSPQGIRDFHAAAIIDATGTWGTPNPLGANGLPAFGELGLSGQIVYGIPDILGKDRQRYTNKTVAVVGAGHSAAGSLAALTELAQHEPDTQIFWIIRSQHTPRVFSGGDQDGLPARGALGMKLQALVTQQRLTLIKDFRITALTNIANKIRLDAQDSQGHAKSLDGIDEIISATGSRPNLALAREIRMSLDPWIESTPALAPLIDPNVHHCGTVRPHGYRELTHPEESFFIVGAKSYGRAPNFLMLTGYEQVRSVVAALAGDLQAAEKVQLVLPETGVCVTDFDSADSPTACCAEPEKTLTPKEHNNTCCGGPAPSGIDACCVKDADAKAAGETGCGCNDNEVPPPKQSAPDSCCG